MVKLSYIYGSMKATQEEDDLDFNSLDWFNIDNYSDVRHFTRGELSLHLAMRNILIYHKFERDVEDGADRNYFIRMLYFMSSKKALVRGGMDEDDVDSSVIEFDSMHFLSTLEKIYKDDRILEGLKILLQELDRDLLEFPEHFKSDNYDGLCHREEFQSIPWDTSTVFDDSLIQIDFMYSDEKIIEDFTNWLKNKREKQTNSDYKRVSEVEFRKWVTQPRLAYIDLYLWQMITGNKLTYPEIVNMLYPNDRSMTHDNFKKTIAEKTIEEFSSRIFDRRFF